MTKLLVKNILEHALSYKWSLQGLGMLRLYLSDAVRLHVWSTGHAAGPKVAKLHTHPWNFKSLVVAGGIEDIRYVEIANVAPNYEYVTIKCGPGGDATCEKKPITLGWKDSTIIPEGKEYSRHRTDIHESRPQDGTVTLVTRTFVEDKDHANVYFPLGMDWNHETSAEPRPATDLEVGDITGYALGRWFK